MSGSGSNGDVIYTYTISGAQWVDGGSLSGTFSIEYDPTGTAVSVEGFDLTTSSTSTWSGSHFVYSQTDASTDTVDPGLVSVDATQPNFSANEMQFQADDGSGMFLDWQTEDPTTVYLDNTPGNETTTELDSSGDQRSLSSGGTITRALACFLGGTLGSVRIL